MNKFTVFVAAAVICASTSAMAMDDKKMDMKMDKKMDMKMMDTNGDGMISKDEFMKYHEMMYDKMKKNKTGMVDMKDMGMMHHDMDMMHKGKTKDKDDARMKDDMAK
jgi:hypothetical protein